MDRADEINNYTACEQVCIDGSTNLIESPFPPSPAMFCWRSNECLHQPLLHRGSYAASRRRSSDETYGRQSYRFESRRYLYLVYHPRNLRQSTMIYVGSGLTFIGGHTPPSLFLLSRSFFPSRLNAVDVSTPRRPPMIQSNARCMVRSRGYA